MKKNFFGTILSIFVLTACQSSSDYIDSVKGDLAEAFRILQGSELSPVEKAKRQQEGWVYVTKIIDGDTFWVDNGAESFKVRLIGVDAPETRNSARKKRGYYGAESREYVRSKIEQQWVRLEFDVQATDRYKRKLAYVYLQDGTFLNASLIEQGYAVVDTHPPNVKYVEQFTALQRQARKAERGLWKETSLDQTP